MEEEFDLLALDDVDGIEEEQEQEQRGQTVRSKTDHVDSEKMAHYHNNNNKNSEEKEKEEKKDKKKKKKKTKRNEREKKAKRPKKRDEEDEEVGDDDGDDDGDDGDDGDGEISGKIEESRVQRKAVENKKKSKEKKKKEMGGDDDHHHQQQQQQKQQQQHADDLNLNVNLGSNFTYQTHGVQQQHKPKSKSKKKPAGAGLDHLVLLKESVLVPDGEPVSVEFHEGRLGLQIADINGRVLVTSFERTSDGSLLQAEASGQISYAFQLLYVGGHDCRNLRMKQVRKLVAEMPRPFSITFQPMRLSSGAKLSPPRSAVVIDKPSPAEIARERDKILHFVRNAEFLEMAGQPFMVRFGAGSIGLKIATAGDRVLVSGFERTKEGFLAQAERCRWIEIGDELISVNEESCLGLNFHDVAKKVAKTPRPVVVGFRPVRVAENGPPPRTLCISCNNVCWLKSKYCWDCGEEISEEKFTKIKAIQARAALKQENDVIHLKLQKKQKPNGELVDLSFA